MKKMFTYNWVICLLLGAAALVVYGLSYGGTGANWNYFVLLADAFWQGRFYLLENPPWLNELINWQGRFYVVYPPMPAVLLMPFVALFGISFPQPYLSIFLASVNVSLSYLVFLKIFTNQKMSFFGSVLYAFGTMQWYHAQVGSAWYIAHIVALFFIWLMFLEILTKKRLILIGLLIGCAYLSRLPTVLAIVFVLLFLSNDFFDWRHKRIYFKNILLLVLGLLPFLGLNFIYNFLRFGTIADVGYRLLPVFEEPWYRYGLFSVKYIPIHLKEIFSALPQTKPDFPFVVPSMNVLALWFVTPAFLLIPFAYFKRKIVWVSVVTVVVMSLPSLTHGGSGFSQFGYRYALDYLPFLLIPTLSGAWRLPNFIFMFLLILSILINFWGVLLLEHFKMYTF